MDKGTSKQISPGTRERDAVWVNESKGWTKINVSLHPLSPHCYSGKFGVVLEQESQDSLSWICITFINFLSGLFALKDKYLLLELIVYHYWFRWYSLRVPNPPFASCFSVRVSWGGKKGARWDLVLKKKEKKRGKFKVSRCENTADVFLFGSYNPTNWKIATCWINKKIKFISKLKGFYVPEVRLEGLSFAQPCTYLTK